MINCLKKVISCTLIFVLFLCASFTYISVNIKAADDSGYSRLISVVYDDSGIMYYGGVDTWCQAKYSMEVFAAMLGNNDTMCVYYMSDYEYGTDAGPRLILNGSDGVSANISKIHNAKTHAMNTPFNSVRRAVYDLSSYEADEKWLVVLTDGAFEDGALPQSEIDLFFNQKPTDINVMFLGIGATATGIQENINNGIYYLEAKTDDQVLNKITEICTHVFNSNKLSNVDLETKEISFDVPMSELIVFAQGNDVAINGIKKEDGTTFKSAFEPVQVKYSECDADNYFNSPVTNLQGMIVTFDDDFDAGKYTLDVTGAETIEIYYKPNVEVAAYLTSSEGEQVADMDTLEAGEYKVSFGFIKGGTKNQQVTSQSSLLGNVQFSASIDNNGTVTENIQNGDTIRIEEGNLTIDALASYLDFNSVRTHLEYTIFKNKAVTLEILDDPAFIIDSDGISNIEDSILVHATIDGREFTQEEWSSLVDPVSLYIVENEPDSSDDKNRSTDLEVPVVEKTDEVGMIRIHPVQFSDKPQKRSYSDMDYMLSFRQIKGNESWTGKASGAYKITDSRSFLERYLDLIIWGLLALLLLIIVLGSTVFKKRLPRKLKKEPGIKVESTKRGGLHIPTTESGKVKKQLFSVLCPFIPETGTIIKYSSYNMSVDAPEIKIRANNKNTVILVNSDVFKNIEHIEINSTAICNIKKTFMVSNSPITVNDDHFHLKSSCRLDLKKSEIRIDDDY